MKKLFTLFAALFFTASMLMAQDNAPIYTANAVTTSDEEWEGGDFDGHFPETTGIKVEVYEGYLIVRGVAGVAGYDLMVEFDSDENVTSLTPIVNGEEGETVTSGYCAFYTGLEGTYQYLQAYIAPQYCYAGSENEELSGYVILSAFDADGNYIYYNLQWPAEEALPEGCLYIAEAEAGELEGEDYEELPYIEVLASKGAKVEVYEGYVIVRSWFGIAGYDMMVEFDAEENVTSVTPIVNGEEGNPVTSGYCKVNTGSEDTETAYLNFYIGPDYAYANTYEGETGYVMLWGYDPSGENFMYYYLTWPVGDGEEGEDAEYVYIWENGGKVGTINWSGQYRFGMDGKDGANECVATFSPEVWETIKSQPIYVTISSENIAAAMIWITDGWWSADAMHQDGTSYLLKDEVTGELVVDEDGFYTLVINLADWADLLATIDDKHLLFTGAGYKVEEILIKTSGTTAIDRVVETPATEHDAMFNLAGQRVGADYKGLVVKNGKVMIIR